MNLIRNGFMSMLPITTGIIPFGIVMGSVAVDAGLSISKSFAMNLIVFAGASQLAALDLMLRDTTSSVIIVTGLIINARFLLYSAAFSPVVQNSRLLSKMVCAYLLTDQTYAVMSAHEKTLKDRTEIIRFYLGASACMLLAWHSSVIAGMVFGNFAPRSWSLDFAVPLSFVALVVPTIKNFKYVIVACFSSVVSILLHTLPFRLGLILTALLSIGLGLLLTARKVNS